MEDLDQNQDDKWLLSGEDKPSRYRSPTFSREEVGALLQLIEKYKIIILNKSTTTAANQSKDAAWAKIAKFFNVKNLGHSRSAESLKMKWENLKKEARKFSKNVLDPKYNEFNSINAHIVSLISESENYEAIDESPAILDEEIDNNENGSGEHKESSNYAQYWDENGDKWSHNESSEDDNDGGESRVRSMNFSPRECSMLLQCVRQEKTHVFSKNNTTRAIESKNRAWSRITHSYNKLSPQKRSTKVLRAKFHNMKTLARKIGIRNYLKNLDTKYKKTKSDSTQKIKKEPLFEYNIDGESDYIDDDNNDDDDDFNKRVPSDAHKQNHNGYINPSHDPLSSVLNDTEIGSYQIEGTWNNSENKEIVKLKIELLKYQMETAKLERKRIEDALKEEAEARETRAIETALRLRAARLESIAARMKLPPSHPALFFPPEEAKAQLYLSQHH